ncbi:thioredoxin domain-containing protein 3 [Ctenodactylus gundi]
MASKKRGEIQLQTVVNNQGLWDEMLQNRGLTVIDVYQAWCGPCKAMQPLFRKLKNELNEDEILHFVVAEVDNIVTLQSFRGKCEPVFLFSLNGKIIAKIQGANAPLVNKKVIELINEERKIAAGEMGRPQYPEIPLTDPEEPGERQSETAEEHYSIVIIKPNAMLRGKAKEIKEKIITAGFVIEAEEKTMLSEEQARDFYSHMADQPDFEEFLYFMTTGLSQVLIIAQKEGESHEEEAEAEPAVLLEQQTEDEVAPTPVFTKRKWDSLQEYLEWEDVSEFCDVEENEDNVSKFIEVFFPDFNITKGRRLERTLALLRPDLLPEKQDDVLNIINNEGFKILMRRQLVLTEEAAKILCKEYENESYFETLIEKMASNPSLALVLLRDDGLQHWKELLGPSTTEQVSEYSPESLCSRFAMGTLPVNQLYGSDSAEDAERDIRYFFPPERTLAVIKPHVTRKQREEILKSIKQEGFDVTLGKDVTLTPELIQKIYYQITTKHFYRDLLEMLAEGPSLVLVLTKWNAIAEWRRLMGPVNPEEARLLSPDSIRAQFGISVLRNAVHGSSSDYGLTEVITALFGEDPFEDAGEQEDFTWRTRVYWCEYTEKYPRKRSRTSVEQGERRQHPPDGGVCELHVEKP